MTTRPIPHGGGERRVLIPTGPRDFRAPLPRARDDGGARAGIWNAPVLGARTSSSPGGGSSDRPAIPRAWLSDITVKPPAGSAERPADPVRDRAASPIARRLAVRCAAAPSDLRLAAHSELGPQACAGDCPRCAGTDGITSRLGSVAVGTAAGRWEREADRAAPVSPPADRWEREADRVAATIVGGAPPSTSGVSPSAPLDADAGLVRAGLSSAGAPLQPAARAFFEPRFGRDLGHVRLHTDQRAASAARSLDALAYTVGNHVVLRDGGLDQHAPAGRRLLAHELSHVVQQSGGGANGLTSVPRAAVQRQTPQPDAAAAPAAPIVPATGAVAAGHRRVTRLVISCTERVVVVETASGVTSYTMDSCSMPLGSFETGVTVTLNNFELDPRPFLSSGHEHFRFRYRIRRGQPNPAELLRGQERVRVDVVERLDAAPVATDPRRQTAQTPECLLRLADRELVPADSTRHNLFEPRSVDHVIWSAPIPVAGFGLVDVAARATGSLTGELSASYGPGRLTNICLGRTQSSETSSAPIDHPLLGPRSRASVTTTQLVGRAHFSLPASLVVTVAAAGGLELSGRLLRFLELAAVRGDISARAVATIAGSIDADVNVIAMLTHSSASLDSPLVPFSLLYPITLDRTSIDRVDLAAEVGLRARASLAFSVNAGAGLRLAGIDVWSQSWNLVNFNAGVAWAGGLRYSPNPGIHLDLGALGEELDLGPAEDDRELETGIREDSADVEEDEVIEAILDEHHAAVAAPDGLTPGSRLPFVWHKPAEIYPRYVDIPNAQDPLRLDRDAGPTSVRAKDPRSPSRSVYHQIGVARRNWLYEHKTFRYFPYDEREEREMTRMRNLLAQLGYGGHAGEGVDVDHVYELQFGGKDRFDNLWPADSSANRSAGTRHRDQLVNYEAALGNLAGRHFIISVIRI